MEGYVDLAYSPEELKEKQTSPLAEAPKYPYALSISLDEKVLEKLDVEHKDWEVGDVFPVDVLLKITGKQVSENTDGEKCCISMQIIAMKPEEYEKEKEEAYTEDKNEGRDLSKHGYLKYSG